VNGSLKKDEGGGQPLLHWVLQRYPDTPKSRAKQWIQTGRVSVAGATIRKPHQVLRDPGEALRLLDRQAPTVACGSGWRIHPRVNLLHLDTSLGIIDKGAGLLSISAEDGDLSALSILADFLAGKLKPRERGVGTVPPIFRQLHPLPVHRLDQYTTGVFCVALNPKARANLIEQLKAHTMRREYVAFVEGRPAEPQGTWRNWLQLSSDGIRQRVVKADDVIKPRETRARAAPQDAQHEPKRTPAPRSAAQEAITHYEILNEFPISGGGGMVSKLRLRLETGRKHQIRIQAAHAGFPLIGDRVYHPKYRDPKAPGVLVAFERQALHSECLKLTHPERPSEVIEFRAGLPQDMRQLEAALRSLRI
jgi:23S rRNA pseudouridine1911/1915/1917 synthase